MFDRCMFAGTARVARIGRFRRTGLYRGWNTAYREQLQKLFNIDIFTFQIEPDRDLALII